VNECFCALKYLEFYVTYSVILGEVFTIERNSSLGRLSNIQCVEMWNLPRSKRGGGRERGLEGKGERWPKQCMHL
jgi:hypothetical protein